MFRGHGFLGRSDSRQPGTVGPQRSSLSKTNTRLSARLHWVGIKDKTADVSLQLDLQPMIQAGVAGFKCFLIHSGVEEFPHVTACDLHAAMKQLQGTGSVLLVIYHNVRFIKSTGWHKVQCFNWNIFLMLCLLQFHAELDVQQPSEETAGENVRAWQCGQIKYYRKYFAPVDQ